jgi:hypothetical protein
MRFMIIVKATKDSEAARKPTEELFKAMADYTEELQKAGVLLDGSGLKPSNLGWRFTWKNGKKSQTDGPFAETKELVAGFTIIQTKTREEALEWTKRFPNPGFDDGEIEVRELYSLDDFESPQAERFRKFDMKSQQ